MQTFKIEKSDSQCVVTWRHFDLSVIIPIIFLAVPAIPILFHLVHMIFVLHKFDEMLFAALLVLGFWLFVFALTAHKLFGETVFVLDQDGLNTIYTCLKYKSEKRFDFAELRRFEKKIRRHKNQTYFLLRVSCHNDNAMRSFRLYTDKGWSFSVPSKGGIEGELDDLCEQLNACLWTLKEKVAGAPAKWEVPEPLAFAYNSSTQHLEPPPKCRWQYQEDFNGFGFRKRNWFCVKTWRFTYGEGEFRTARLLSAKIKHYDLTAWNSLEVRVVRQNEEDEPEDKDKLQEFYEDSQFWQITFLDKNKDNLAVIENLHNPEALWMADVVLRERRTIK